MLKRKKNKKTIKKTLAWLGIASMLLLQAFPMGVQAAESIDSLTTGKNGTAINKEAQQNMLSSAQKKQTGPTVSINFTSDGQFKVGSRVIAKAETGGSFTTPEDELYYTWYLKRDGCDETNNWWKGATGGPASCDLDGDGAVTPNDWKITATRIIVRGDFDLATAKDAATYSGAVADSGFEAKPIVDDSDSTAWPINFLRDASGDLYEENDEDAPDCYVQQPTSGNIYELRQTNNEMTICPTGYHPACLKDATTNCTVLNPLYVNQSNYLSQNCVTDPWTLIETCTWSGVPSDSKAVVQPFSACVVSHEDTNANINSVWECSLGGDVDELENYAGELVCKDDSSETPLCVPGSPGSLTPWNTSDGNLLYYDNNGKLVTRTFASPLMMTSADTGVIADVCGSLAKPNEYTDYWRCPVFDAFDPVCYDAPGPWYLDNSNPRITTSDATCAGVESNVIYGSGATVNLSQGGSGYSVSGGQNPTFPQLQPACEFNKGVNLCKHLFPYFPEKNVTVYGNPVNFSDSDMTGDGDFSMEEKQFWTADPDAASTNGSTIKDEAVVMGLGINSFTWILADGDEVGVVVEGDSSLANDHSVPGYKRMWAFSQNQCPALKEIEKSATISSGETGFYEENGSHFLATEFNLDRCLKDNLESPGDGGLGKVVVTVTTSPPNPMNDEGGMGDQVTINCSAQNVDSLSSLYYDYDVDIADTGSDSPSDETTYTEITNDLVNTWNSMTPANQSGLSNNSTFKLNIPTASLTSLAGPTAKDTFWLRARCQVEEKGAIAGRGYTVFKVTNQSNKIEAYRAAAKPDGDLYFEPIIAAPEICPASMDICPVTQYQIIGLKIPDPGNDLSGMTWKINGYPIVCNSNISTSDCAAGEENLFFPILGNEGESITVVGTAISASKKAKVEIIKRFVVSPPSITIVSTDTNTWPKLLGYYRPLESGGYTGSCFADPTQCTANYSKNVFETFNGTQMKFQAAVNTGWNVSNNYFWTVDGETQYNAVGGVLSINADKPAGESYDIGVMQEIETADLTAVNGLRLALKDNWGVTAEEIPTQSLYASVQVDVVDDATLGNAGSGQTGLFASLVTNLPQQLIFVLKIVLTALLLIFSMGLLFYLMPESLFERNKNN